LPDETVAAHGAEIALAAACAEGRPDALAIFEREVLARVPDFVRGIDSSMAFADEVAQQLRARLLVAGPGEVPRVGFYGGRGALGGWVKVVAVRIALDTQRRSGLLPGNEDQSQRLVDLALGPEDLAAKAEHHVAIQEALRKALGALTVRERTLLRLRHAEDWSPEDLGRSYNVHRGTIARWLSVAREKVRDHMAKHLTVALGFSASELVSVVRAVESRLDISLSRLE
jgi:RNA polymerase sigma-70 factor (ECF subfamily)